MKVPPGRLVSVREALRTHAGLLLALALAALAVTLPFWFSDLDMRSAAWFYVPDAPGSPWPYQDHWLWHAIYKGDWLIAGTFALVAIGAILLSYRVPRLALWRPRGWFLLLIIVLGSGLVVNAIFKDHWGRYRPRQVEQLGGVHPYVPPLAIGTPGEGKSFPCGHCSVGFAFYGFWFIWLRRRPGLAWAMFAFATFSGVLIGVGRLSAGGHFLSDTLWSGLLMFATAALIYHALLKVPQREARIAAGEGAPRMDWRQRVLIGTSASAVIAGVLLAKPMAAQSSYAPGALQQATIQRVMLDADHARVRIRVVPVVEGVRIDHKTHSFGFPGNKVHQDVTLGSDGVLNYRLSHSGIYTERDTEITLQVDPDWVGRVHVRVANGDIYVPAGQAGRFADLQAPGGAVIAGRSEQGLLPRK